jgi:multidrug efflux pump subunit AcrA (membrane-fusion protein)
MSDMLQTNRDLSAINANEDVDAAIFQPLYQEEDGSSQLALPRKRRPVRLIVISIVLLLLLIGGGVYIYLGRAHASVVLYTTVPTSIGNLTETVSASGPLQAKAEYDMNFSASGQISAIDVHVGQQVKAGQVLAKLMAPNLQIAVQEAQISVNNAQNTYNTVVANGDSTATLTMDSNALQSAQLQLQTAQNDLAAATLTAPGNAVVAAINGIVGQNASSSSSSTSFIVLLDTAGFTITSLVNEADIANVQVNQSVRFTVTAYAGQTFRATVSSISVVGTSSSGVVGYPVTLVINMDSIGTAHLYPGMTATATITTAQRIGALLISNSAFTFPTTALQAGVISRSALTQGFGGSGGTSSGTTTSNTGSRHIVLVLRNGKLVPVLITTGLTNGTFSEVLSGLKQGDQIVVSATGGAFANLSSTSTNTSGSGLFRTGGGSGGGAGGTRTGTGG